jgi:uncharacterized protein (UPF0332 family)
LEAGDWEAAVSRAYYAVYHAVIALIESRAGVRRRRWDHDVVQEDFRAQFSRRGFLFGARDASAFSGLLEDRLIADYDQKSTSRATAVNSVATAHDLVERIGLELK